MLILEEVRKRLSDRKVTTVAEATGLSYDTVWRVQRGDYTRVSYDTVKALSDYLEAKGND
jgi:DNA-binding Xre family transcriptional regulator